MSSGGLFSAKQIGGDMKTGFNGCSLQSTQTLDMFNMSLNMFLEVSKPYSAFLFLSVSEPHTVFFPTLIHSPMFVDSGVDENLSFGFVLLVLVAKCFRFPALTCASRFQISDSCLPFSLYLINLLMYPKPQFLTEYFT